MANYQVYCHMATSIDGKVTGNFLTDPRFKPYENDWFELFFKFNKQMKNWIVGRVSFEQILPKEKVDLSEFIGQKTDRKDYIASFDSHDKFAISLDPDGKLNWYQGEIGDENPALKGDKIVSILSENVSDEYLLYLQKIGVSYIFAGQNKPLNIKLALDKLHQYFDIQEFLLVGGGVINGSFIQASLIDTISIVQAPLVESDLNSVSLFQSHIQGTHLPLYKLVENDVLKSGALHMIYEKVGD
ncbi:hypothetical protein MHD_06700 [Mannheimia granulomatis]|uniref:Deaminase reductase n=1 Tax=Mannheimia granulomatis TaxID=85402 RepID=A0A011LZX5_9PAST|nr:dihydrofolate reductase family protein [Mannheimia granulomatis]EXI62808.1 deaminase reductase [Mannheimia granulomatis]RGE48164.1 hypothetical protein MHD_06700 [Mannheimia granulomatis]